MAKDEVGLLLELNQVFVNRIADKVIDRLLNMRDRSYLLSGDDSGLKNLWEEICIQRQTEYSHFWSMYEELMEGYIEDELDKQPSAIQKLISYIGSIEKSDAEGIISIYTDAAIQEVKNKLMQKAGVYTNKNIERFLEQ